MGRPAKQDKILNPSTGRMVAKNGAIGRALVLAKASPIRRSPQLESSDGSGDDSDDSSDDSESCSSSRVDDESRAESDSADDESRVDSASEVDGKSHADSESDTENRPEDKYKNEDDAEVSDDALLKSVDTKNFKLDGRILPFHREALLPPNLVLTSKR